MRWREYERGHSAHDNAKKTMTRERRDESASADNDGDEDGNDDKCGDVDVDVEDDGKERKCVANEISLFNYKEN